MQRSGRKSSGMHWVMAFRKEGLKEHPVIVGKFQEATAGPETHRNEYGSQDHPLSKANDLMSEVGHKTVNVGVGPAHNFSPCCP